jgi:translocation and assembly module TamA
MRPPCLPRGSQLLLCAFFLFLLFLFLAASATSGAGPPVRVVVQGVGGEVLANVESALVLPPGLIREGKVNKPWLERFEEQAGAKVREALEPFGYFAPDVKTSLETTAEETYVLRVDIEPGEPVRVNEITVTLEGAGSAEKALTSLAKGFPLKRGDVLLQGRYEEAKGMLRAKAVELGYLDADFPAHEIRIFESQLKAVVTLKLNTGPRYLFGETSFKGTGRYGDHFLRRYLAYKPGDVFSYSKLAATHLNLINSDRFKSVIVTPEKQEASELRVPVLIKLEPSDPKRLRFGVGYGTDTGARLTVGYRDLDIFGTDHEFNSTMNLSQKLQGLGANYIIPDSRDIESYTEIKFNLKREDVTTYTNKLVSLEGERTKSMGKGRILSLYLRIQKEDFTVGDERGNSRLILPGVRISGRHFDSLVRPKNAYRYEIDIRGTHRILGSDTRLFQIVAEGNKITPLPWRISLLTRIKAGVTLQGDPIEKLPASMRFFAGGDRSVRGYAYQSLGPKDAAGNVVGGKNIFVGSIELEKPVFGDWGLATFYDVGNAFNSLSSITLFQGAGVGIRYYTKFGTAKLDVARQIGIDNPKFRLHFNVGAEF